MRIWEVVQNNNISGAAFWLQRWISGSMNDPDWAEGEKESAMNVEQAFEIIKKVAGNKYAVGKPLWRYLNVDSKTYNFILKNKILPVNPSGEIFQSFTTSLELAKDFASDVYSEKNKAGIIISANIPPNDIMFSWKDVKKCRNSELKIALLALEDWEYQDEVIVRVKQPIKLLSVKKYAPK